MNKPYYKDMKIVVFGANGRVGRLVVMELLSRGHKVRAVVHRGTLDGPKELEVVSGDIYDPASIDAALRGCDAVISALGSWGTPKKDVLSTAMESIVPLMSAQGIRRIVSLTGDGAKLPGERSSLVRMVMRSGIQLLAPRILADGEKHLATLSKSTLDWTVVRSPVMYSSDNRAYSLSNKSASVRISRRAVVQAMCDLLESHDWLQQAPFLRKR